MSKGHVVVIDDDAAVLESIEAMLTVADFDVRVFASPTVFFATLDSLPPSCVVTDVRMPEMSGLALVKRLGESGRGDWPLIVVSGHADVAMAVSAMRAGASNFLEKPFVSGALVQAILDALAVRRSINAQTPGLEEARDRFQTLSRREREVLTHLVKGASSKVTAMVLGISPRTVDVFRCNILRKMQTPNIAALATLVGRGLAA
ncbi:MAG: response regulator transcription factor [Brevundimonas sp.]|jgi:two-component system response regulator FixJ